MKLEKLTALSSRASKMQQWVSREKYSVYAGEESVADLVWLINLIIWAFEQSIPKEEWEPFFEQFKAARAQINDVFETEEARSSNYQEVVTALLNILEKYKTHIATL